MVISPSGAAPAQTRGRGKSRPNKTKHPRRGRKNAKSYQRNKGKNIGQAPRKWIKIYRKPGPQARFVVPTWVAIDELTPEERSKYVPEDPVVEVPSTSTSVPTAASINTVAVAVGNQSLTQATGAANANASIVQGQGIDNTAAVSSNQNSGQPLTNLNPPLSTTTGINAPQVPDRTGNSGSHPPPQVANGNDQQRHPTG